MNPNSPPHCPSAHCPRIPNSHPDRVPVRCRSPEHYIVRSMSEAAAAGFNGEVVTERPFNMRFEAAARHVAYRRRRRLATAHENGRDRNREKLFLSNRVIDRM